MRELEEDLGIPRAVVSEIFMEDLGMNHVAAKFVLHLLSEKQKEFRAEVAQDLLETSNNDPEKKAQSFQWMLSESPHPKKVQQSQNIKTMSTVFYCKGVFHHKYAPPGQTK